MPKAKGKSQRQKASHPKAKAKSQNPKLKQKNQSPLSSFNWSFINSGKQGGAVALWEGHDIVTGESCIPASLNTNNLGETAVLLLGLCQS
jgi:hypothetical protein